MIAPLQQHLRKRQTIDEAGQSLKTTSVLTTPVFIGHGRDDAYVNIELGQQAHQLLTDVGFTAVEWRDYEGAEQEGHWLKEPVEMNDLARFLEKERTIIIDLDAFDQGGRQAENKDPGSTEADYRCRHMRRPFPILSIWVQCQASHEGRPMVVSLVITSAMGGSPPGGVSRGGERCVRGAGRRVEQ